MDIQLTDNRDSAIISRVLNGETNAYRILYDSNVELLYRFLKQFKKNDGEVQELVQRAFIKAYEGLKSFNQRSKFKTWLFQIALNELRSDVRRNAILPFIDVEEIDEASAAQQDIPIEWNATLKTIFDTLDETKRMVFILYEVEGYSHAEISVMLGIGESSSRTILTRTKQQLRSQLKGMRKTA